MIALSTLPLAAAGLISYRYRGRHGWIMIGAHNDDDALNEAQRVTGVPADRCNLQVWRDHHYVPAEKQE